MLMMTKAMEHEIMPDRLYLDPLVLPTNAAQDQGRKVVQAVQMFQALNDPAPRTVVGLSNVSNGTKQRGLLNRTFLAMLMGAGLTAAICDPEDAGAHGHHQGRAGADEREAVLRRVPQGLSDASTRAISSLTSGSSSCLDLRASQAALPPSRSNAQVAWPCSRGSSPRCSSISGSTAAPSPELPRAPMTLRGPFQVGEPFSELMLFDP